MTFPAATFTAVAPPPDGLALAFTSARRRRNSKAAVSAFGGAVAIASVLSFLAPPGQSLVQEPAQPASGGLLSGLVDAPRHGAPAPLVRTPASSPVIVGRASSTQLVRPGSSVRVHSSSVPRHSACASSRVLACVDVDTPVPDGPTVRARICPSAATVTVEYDASPVGPTRISASRTVGVGSCPA